MPDSTANGTKEHASTEPLPRYWRDRLAILWGVLILLVVYLSLDPRVAPPDVADADKLSHIIAYSTLAALPFAAFATRRVALIAALAMLPMGAGLELAQEWVPGRTADIFDMVANLTGVTVGIMLGPWLLRRITGILARTRGPDRP